MLGKISGHRQLGRAFKGVIGIATASDRQVGSGLEDIRCDQPNQPSPVKRL